MHQMSPQTLNLIENVCIIIPADSVRRKFPSQKCCKNIFKNGKLNNKPLHLRPYLASPDKTGPIRAILIDFRPVNPLPTTKKHKKLKSYKKLQNSLRNPQTCHFDPISRFSAKNGTQKCHRRHFPSTETPPRDL